MIRKYAVAILAVVTIVLYIPSLFGQFVWDDEDFVYANQHVTEFNIGAFFTQSATSGRGKASNYYRPLQLMSYALDYRVAGTNPWLFHAINILWHVAAGVLWYVVLCRLGVPWGLSFGASLVFLLHPLQTEAVSYVSGRSDMMFVTFLLLSFLFFQKKELRYGSLLSLFFFVCALLSKESGLLALAFFPALTFITYGFSKNWRNALKRFVPHIIVALGYLLIRFTALEFLPAVQQWGDVPYAHSLIVRIATFFRNYFVYWSVLLAPVDLHMERDESTVHIISTLTSQWTLWFLLAQAMLIAFLVWIYRTSRLYGCIAIGGYIGMHAVLGFYSGVVLLNGIFYEHYLYSALPFACLLLGSGIAVMKPSAQKVTLMVLGVWLLVFGVVTTIRRQLDWINPVRFYEQTLAHAPRSSRIINGLGMAYAEEKNFKQALLTYQKGIALNPQIPNFYHNTANVYNDMGEYANAERYYLKALEADPKFYFSAQQLVQLYRAQGKSDKEKEIIQRMNESLRREIQKGN